MIIDGKKIREELKETLVSGMLFLPTTPKISIVVVGKNPVIEQFINVKERFGKNAGFIVDILRFDEEITEDDLAKEIEILAKSDTTGISIELPLPKHISSDRILNIVPVHKDVDVLSQEGRDAFALGRLTIFPPVVGAINEIFERSGVDVKKSRIVVIGRGRLVGEPVLSWLTLLGVKPIVVSKGDDSLAFQLKGADIIISGAGSPHLIKPEMLQENVVLIDAGTSEIGEGIVGDIDPSCQKKAKIFAPVPGGVGPLTVFFLYKNVLDYAHRNQMK